MHVLPHKQIQHASDGCISKKLISLGNFTFPLLNFHLELIFQVLNKTKNEHNKV